MGPSQVAMGQFSVQDKLRPVSARQGLSAELDLHQERWDLRRCFWVCTLRGRRAPASKSSMRQLCACAAHFFGAHSCADQDEDEVSALIKMGGGGVDDTPVFGVVDSLPRSELSPVSVFPVLFCTNADS